MYKNQLISDLYNGNIRPIEGDFIKGTHSNNLSIEVDSLISEIEKLLGDDGKKLFHAYVEGSRKVLCLNCEERFIQGFKLGGRLAIEMLCKDDEIKV